jgi:hypothetical protein
MFVDIILSLVHSGRKIILFMGDWYPYTSDLKSVDVESEREDVENDIPTQL